MAAPLATLVADARALDIDAQLLQPLKKTIENVRSQLEALSVDKRFKPLSPAEALQARRALVDELTAAPTMPIPAVVRKIRASLRLMIAEYAKLCGVLARTLQDIEREELSPTLVTAEKLLRPMGMVPGATFKTGHR